MSETWTVDASDAGRDRVWVLDGDRQGVARISYNGTVSRQVERARLIAAAPDLLAALEAMVQRYQPFTSRPVGAPNSPARREQEADIALDRQARAAISKAKGLPS